MLYCRLPARVAAAIARLAGKKQGDQMVRLDGVRVLLVEDEYYIADDLWRALERSGAEVVGPVATLAGAEGALDSGGFDCAIVDLNLHGESAVSIAERLMAARRPLALATGYGGTAVPDVLRDVPRLEKPFEARAAIGLVERLVSARV
jgi:DNA-binding NtrC family response regulator